MPSFDITSEVDMQEVRNAVDQASTRSDARFDFKDTGSSVELKPDGIELKLGTEDRLRALVQVLEEKLVRRQVSLKALDYQKVEEASRGAVRRQVKLAAGIGPEHTKKINRLVKDLGLKGVSSQAQGDQIRVTGKKRDELQSVIAKAEGARTSASRSSSATSATTRRPAAPDGSEDERRGVGEVDSGPGRRRRRPSRDRDAEAHHRVGAHSDASTAVSGRSSRERAPDGPTSRSLSRRRPASRLGRLVRVHREYDTEVEEGSNARGSHRDRRECPGVGADQA